MKAKAVVQPKQSTHSEDVTHGGGRTRRLYQLDPLLLCDRVFQLPPDLKCADGQLSIHNIPTYSGTLTSSKASGNLSNEINNISKLDADSRALPKDINEPAIAPPSPPTAAQPSSLVWSTSW